ncbi:MAG: FimV family protein [Vogesella sp.]|uniref:type IV pilus assembly protein FimV n=1 Tax=Vogesella sp. TaxID=1904252 RepID=UPI00391B5B66
MENPFVALASRERYSTLAPYSDKAAQLQIRTVETSPNQYMVRITGPVLSAGEVMNFALELSWPSGKVVREYRVNGGSSSPAKSPAKDDASAALAERHPLIDEPGGLAFGEARLLSALGLPLRAEIELLGDWPSSLASDSFQLSAFNDPALSAARIEVHQRKGRQWLTIRSETVLKAALLRFTLSTQQQDEQIRRDFTLRATQRGSYLSAALPAAVPAFKGSYKVQPGDTLSGLAYRFAGGKPVARVAREIYAANPQAFAHGNPDRLFAGSLLKVPEAGGEAANVQAPTEASSATPAVISGKAAPAAAAAQPVAPAKVDEVAKPASAVVSQQASAPQASVVQDASAAQAAALEQEKLAQLKAAQQRLAWLEAEINRLSSQASQPRVIPHRPDMDASADQDEAFLDENLTQWVLYGVGGLSVASLLAWLLVKRRRASKPKVTVPSLGRAGMGPVTISASLGPDEQPLVQPIADDINLQTIDVLAEADVLMAYGRFDAAEQLLRESLSNEPEREDLRMKLLDLIARKGNKQEFESVALDLLAVFGPESALWKRVLQLGGNLDPDNPLYRPAPDQPEHFAMAKPPAVDLGVFAPDSEDRVPLTSQVDNAEAAQDLARLYREMGDTETADALLREAGVKQ